MPFPPTKFSTLLAHRKEFVRIDDIQLYKRARVQLHWKGIVLRDEVEGALIKTKEQQVARAGELLVAEIDAKVGGVGIVSPELNGAIVSSHYFLFQIDESKCLRPWLDWFVRSGGLADQFSARGSTNYAAIRPHHVLNCEIPLPPLDEQSRIVSRIKELSARIEESKGLRQKASEETEALMTAALRRSFTMRDGLRQVNLEEVCETIIDNLHSNPLYADSGVPCVRSPDVGWGDLYLDRALTTSEDEYKRRTIRGEPQPDDIVLVREGGGTGKAALVTEGQRFSLGQRVMMIRPDKAVVLPKFFLYQLLSPHVFRGQVLELTKGSASPHLNIGALKKFTFLLPSLDCQTEIVNYLDELKRRMSHLQKLQSETATELDALMPSILFKAFRGEL